MKTRFWDDDGNISSDIDMKDIRLNIKEMFKNWISQGLHERDFIEAIIHSAQLELFDFYVCRDFESEAAFAEEKPSSLKWVNSIEEYDPSEETPTDYVDYGSICSIEEFHAWVNQGLFSDDDGSVYICDESGNDSDQILCGDVITGKIPDTAKFIKWYNK